MDLIIKNPETQLIVSIDQAKENCKTLYELLNTKLKTVNKLEIILGISLLSNISFEDKRLCQKHSFFADSPSVHFLVGLCLKDANVTQKEPLSENYSEVFGLLESYFYNFYLAITPPPDQRSDEEKVIFSAKINGLISQTSSIRYPFQTLELLNDTFYPLNDYFNDHFGFTIDDAVNYSFLIYRYTKGRMEGRINEVGLSQKEDSEKKKLFFSRLRDVGGFSSDQFFKDKKITNINSFKKYLSVLSSHFGSENHDYCSPLDDNSFLTKPILEDEGNFFAPIPVDLIQKLPSILEDLLLEEKKQNSRIWEKYAYTKAKYTERMVVEYLKRIFRDDEIYSNLHYSINGRRFEVDHLLTYGDNVIIIETKSGNFSIKARRGAIERIKTDLKKLICDAHNQGLRTKDYIKTMGIVEFSNSSGETVVKINYQEGKTNFILINVTLEPLFSFSSSLKNIEKLGIFSNNDYPWSVSLSELDLITRFIDLPPVFLHYVERRLEAQNQNNLHANNEISFLALYLDKGTFSFFDEKKEAFQSIYFDDDVIKPFTECFINGKEAPKLKINEKIKSIITELDQLRPEKFTKITNTLLDYDHVGRKDFIRELDSTFLKTQVDGELQHSSGGFNIYRNIGFTILCQIGGENLRERLSKFCRYKHHENKTDIWVGFGIDVTNTSRNISEYVVIDSKWKKNKKMEKEIKTGIVKI